MAGATMAADAYSNGSAASGAEGDATITPMVPRNIAGAMLQVGKFAGTVAGAGNISGIADHGNSGGGAGIVGSVTGSVSVVSPVTGRAA